jgi:hypothetical protein
MIRSLVFAVLLALGWSAAMSAETIGAASSRSAHEGGAVEEGEEREHQPRHGGSFGDADDLYHYEVLLNPDNQLVLYVNDEHNRPLDVRALEGRWTLNPDSSAPMTGAFTPSADGAIFFASLPPLKADPVHVKVAVPKDGVWAEMEFYLPAHAQR